jgi:hypothetical protein
LFLIIGQVKEIVHDIRLHVSGMKVLKQGSIDVDKLKWRELKYVPHPQGRIQSLNENIPLLVQDIVRSLFFDSISISISIGK